MRTLKGPDNLANNGWQKYCTEILNECARLQPETRAIEWNDARRQLLRLASELIHDKTQQRIVIADANYNNADLHGFDFRRCYFARTNIISANLRGCVFARSIFRKSSLNSADAQGADFSLADFRECDLLSLKFNKKTNFNLNDLERTEVSPELRDKIQRDRAAAASRSSSMIMRAVYWVTDHGYGIFRVLFGCSVLIFIFACGYWGIGTNSFAIGVSGVSSQSLTFLSFVFLSLERFLNASPWIFGITPLSHFMTTIEGFFGLVAFGLLVSMLTRKIMR